jgi:hypothetical protein
MGVEGGIVKLICRTCGKEFDAYPAGSTTRKHCSRECNPNTQPCLIGCTCKKHTNNKVIKNCLTCATEFLDWPSGKRKYCSQQCYPRPGWNGKVGERKVRNNSNWKGGRIVDDNGRVAVYAPGNLDARMGQGQYIFEYRLIAAEKIGRPLTSDEIVHHIDGDPTNNHPDNLQVMTQAEHCRLHSLAFHAARREKSDVK